MSNDFKKAVLFVPFWRQSAHVGNNRVDRFRRWLIEEGYELVIVLAGTREAVRYESWGQEITVVDRLGLHPESDPDEVKQLSNRKPNRFRRALANWLFNPDPAIVWSKAAARHPKVNDAMQGAKFILSSSPPESAHVGAWLLSRKFSVPHIMDMRDGWLDEPLKPLLNSSALRRWLESRLESRIANHAMAIQVTSDIWKELFDVRYPHLANKTHILTNSYLPNMPNPNSLILKAADEERVLIHAGRFMGSHMKREPELLMEPLLKNLTNTHYKGVIRFYGDLSEQEVVRLEDYQPRFNSINWRVEFHGSLPRAKMLDVMQNSDGLLLLSASHAALPSKMFEYLATGLPIGYVAEVGCATEKLLKKIKSSINLESESLSGILEPDTFHGCIAPVEYSEPVLKRKFKEIYASNFNF